MSDTILLPPSTSGAPSHRDTSPSKSYTLKTAKGVPIRQTHVSDWLIRMPAESCSAATQMKAARPSTSPSTSALSDPEETFGVQCKDTKATLLILLKTVDTDTLLGDHELSGDEGRCVTHAARVTHHKDETASIEPESVGRYKVSVVFVSRNKDPNAATEVGWHLSAPVHRTMRIPLDVQPLAFEWDGSHFQDVLASDRAAFLHSATFTSADGMSTTINVGKPNSGWVLQPIDAGYGVVLATKRSGTQGRIYTALIEDFGDQDRRAVNAEPQDDDEVASEDDRLADSALSWTEISFGAQSRAGSTVSLSGSEDEGDAFC
ncbi:uncharacterized protein MKK02DRAFT_31268 [Dioszegia hungarica]|uniref:Uncharacterized protein n=1 Tax=Dioszegia hungarica TaxID=4972 RepID=A0AA38HG47_9TREE|nr:uncharacterized protein MKK02DRAFT_31268 [Dioszegia hungarica]KAI9639004.1 hypothetical protein MKK02DRAFT_31268 [Dioszegia hungarica]